MENIPLLIVDADQDASLRLAQMMRRLVKRVLCVATGDEAIRILSQEPAAGMFCELTLSHRSGLTLIAEARRLQPGLPVVVVTGDGSMEHAIDAFRSGVSDFIFKPVCQSDAVSAWERIRCGADKQSHTAGVAVAGNPPVISVPLNGSLKQIEKQIVEAVIFHLDGNKAAAARALGIHRKALYRLLAQ